MPKHSNSILNAFRYYMAIKRKFKKELDFSKRRSEFYKDFWDNAATQVDAGVESLGDDYYRITKGGHSTLVRYHFVCIDKYLSLMLVGQKPLVQRILAGFGCRVPRYVEYDLHSLNIAQAFMDRHEGCFVVKPIEGSGGHGITTGVSSKKRLRSATIAASASFKVQKLMIEEVVKGDSYRLLYLDGRLVDVVKRKRPTVVGNGRSSLGDLIRQENVQRLESIRAQSLTQLTVDLDAKFFFEDHGLSLSMVPRSGELVAVKNVANENSSRDNLTVSSGVHPSFDSLAIHLKKELGLVFIGIDVMATDLCKPLEETGGAIIEINIPPGLHYHVLVDNPEKMTCVGSEILNFIL